MQRPDLPPWLYPPPRAPRFAFNSGAVAFGAGVDTFLGRIRTAPGLALRLALFGVSGFAQGIDNRLSIRGAGCADWASVTTIGMATPIFEMPIFLILPHDSEAEVFYRRSAATTEVVRLLGWGFDPRVL